MWTDEQILAMKATNDEKARFAEQAFLMSKGMSLHKAVVEGNSRAKAGAFESPLARKILG